MTLTSEQLVRLASMPYGDNGLGGAVEAVVRNASRNGNGYLRLHGADIRGLRAMASPPPPKKRYHNPTYVAPRPRATTQPLTASDIAWMQNLPSDPVDMSFDDARALARLDGDFESPGDRRLVRQKLVPVRRYHEARAAEVARDNLRNRPEPKIDTGTLTRLLTDAVQAEVPDLTEPEAVARAGQLLRDALDQAARTRAADRDRAEAAITVAARPFNPEDLAQDSPAYQEFCRAAALSGNNEAQRALRDHQENMAGVAG